MLQCLPSTLAVPVPGVPITPLEWGYRPESEWCLRFFAERIAAHKKHWTEHVYALDERRRDLRRFAEQIWTQLNEQSRQIAKLEDRISILRYNRHYDGSDTIADRDSWVVVDLRDQALAQQQATLRTLAEYRVEDADLVQQHQAAYKLLLRLAQLPNEYLAVSRKITLLYEEATRIPALVQVTSPCIDPLERDAAAEALHCRHFTATLPEQERKARHDYTRTDYAH